MAPFGLAQGRLEIVPFPKYAVAGVFPQPVKPCPSRKPFMKARLRSK